MKRFKIIISLSLLLFYSVYFTSAFYGNPLNSTAELPTIIDAAAVTVGDKIYLIGGQVLDKLNNNYQNSTSVTVVQFTDPTNDLLVNKITPSNPFVSCMPCQGYALADNNTIVIANVQFYETYFDNITNTTVHPSVLGFYHISNNSFTYGIHPRNSTAASPSRIRHNYSSAISINGDTIFVLGGDNEISASKGIFSYDIKNTSSITDLSYTGSDLYIGGSCAVMLPNGLIVMAFGGSYGYGLYETNFVKLYDTNSNVLRNQSIGIGFNYSYPEKKSHIACALGPDKTTIYYYGGETEYGLFSDSKIHMQGYFNNLVMLDTGTWSWIQPTVPGEGGSSVSRARMVLFGQEQNELIITSGMYELIHYTAIVDASSPANGQNSTTGNYYTASAPSISVLRNVPQLGQSLLSNNLQWFTNYPPFDNYATDGGDVGLINNHLAKTIIAVIAIVILSVVLLWVYYVPISMKVAKVAAYMRQGIMLDQRPGEPFWAEACRICVRSFLSFLFLILAAYLIYEAVSSPIVIQQIVTTSDKVPAPDIRFCFDGFQPTHTSPYVDCTFLNGTTCSDRIYKLDMTLYTPFFFDQFGNVSCFLFLPGNAYYLVKYDGDYQDTTGTKLLFSFFGQNTTADITRGVVHIKFYPSSAYDPNAYVYKLHDRAQLVLTELEFNQWHDSEQSINSIDDITLKQTMYTTASYTLTTSRTLKRQDPWNYIGFSPSYDERLDISISYKDSPQNVALMPSNLYGLVSPFSQLAVQPSSFYTNTNVDQKVFTLLNAFGQIGGVFGLFITMQTLLFGFRPQSPWGIIHRSSFGRWRAKLTDMLTGYFGNMKNTSVPLVNPVNGRLYTANRHIFGNDNSSYSAIGSDSPSPADESFMGTAADENGGDNANQELRLRRLEERQQLMELLLKSYYLNDEVFKSLDKALKSGTGNGKNNGQDSLLNLNVEDNTKDYGPKKGEEVEISAACGKKDSGGSPSSSAFVPQQEDNLNYSQ